MRTVVDPQPCPQPPIFDVYEDVDPDLLAQIRRDFSKWKTYSDMLRVRARCEE
jgi:hypothetical protein